MFRPKKIQENVNLNRNYSVLNTLLCKQVRCLFEYAGVYISITAYWVRALKNPPKCQNRVCTVAHCPEETHHFQIECAPGLCVSSAADARKAAPVYCSLQ